jgi:hypothetical protein
MQAEEAQHGDHDDNKADDIDDIVHGSDPFGGGANALLSKLIAPADVPERSIEGPT